MGDEHGGQAGGPVDPRIDWLRSRVISALRCKEDKFDRLLGIPEEMDSLKAFLDSDLTRIIIYDNGKGDLTVVRGPCIIRPSPADPCSGSAAPPAPPPRAGGRAARGAAAAAAAGGPARRMRRSNLLLPENAAPRGRAGSRRRSSARSPSSS